MKRSLDLIWLLLIFVVFIWIFKYWFISPTISSGDSWYYFNSMFQNHFIYPYSWYLTVVANGLGGQGFAYTNVNIVVALILSIGNLLHLGWGSLTKIFLYIPFVFLSFSTSTLLIKKVFPNNKFWFFAPIIFSLNTYILMMTGGGQIITAISYALSPLTLYIYMKIIDTSYENKNRFIYLFLSILFLSLQMILDLRIAFVTLIAVIIYFLISLFSTGIKKNINSLLFLFFSFFIVVLVNAYWILPIALFGIDPIKQLGTDYSSVGIVKFLSFATLENSIGLLHPYWPENIFGKIGFMKPEFLILPILAFSSLLFLKEDRKKSKFVLFFATIGLFGVFLGKGASDPLGSIYLWLFTHVPGFQLFRDSFKWYLLIALSYSILIPFALNEISDLIKSKFKLKYVSILITILAMSYFLFLLRPALLGNLNGTFKSKSVPAEYKELESYLTQDKSFYRTLWIPNTELFGYYSNNNPSISGRDFFRQFDNSKLLNRLSSEDSKQIIDYSSVKYVIVPQDSEGEIYLTDRKYDDLKYQKIVTSLGRINWLKKDKEFGKIVVYKTPENKDHFWCNCTASISYKFINPTKYIVSIKNAREGDLLIFSESYDPKWTLQNKNLKVNSRQFEGLFNSFSLPAGDGEYEVIYSAQKIVDIGIIVSLVTILFSIIILTYVVISKKNKK